MEPTLRTLVNEVPKGWLPQLLPKKDDERIVGKIRDLEKKTRSMVVAAFWYRYVADQLTQRHDDLHTQGKVTSGSKQCFDYDDAMAVLKGNIERLLAASQSGLNRKITLRPGESAYLRPEGIVATMQEGAAAQVVARTTGANTEAPDNNGPDMKAIEDLLLEVPQFYRIPLLPPGEKDERYVGRIDQLDNFTFRMIRGVFFFLELGADVTEGHKLDHAQPGFKGGGEACRKYLDRIQTLDQKVTKLQNASGPRLKLQIEPLKPGENFAFRFGLDIVAIHRMEELSVLPKPGEHPCETPTPAQPSEEASAPARRSFMSRILHR